MVEIVLVIISELELSAGHLLAGITYLSRLPEIRRVDMHLEPLRYVLEADRDVTVAATAALREALSDQVTITPLRER